MTACDGCEEWYHEECIDKPSNVASYGLALVTSGHVILFVWQMEAKRK